LFTPYESVDLERAMKGVFREQGRGGGFILQLALFGASALTGKMAGQALTPRLVNGCVLNSAFSLYRWQLA
jgi:hypothetical protein